MVNQITANQQRFLCHNSINLNCFTICTDMWDAAAKGQEQVSGENSFWQKHLLTLTWIHCATLTWGWADLAALCWSGQPLVQLHTLHYLWLPSEPLWRQFWAINWQRIRERTLQSHWLLHHFQFASWRGQQDGLNPSSSCILVASSPHSTTTSQVHSAPLLLLYQLR